MEPFAKVPQRVALDASLSSSAMRVYLVLTTFLANDGVTCWPSVTKVASLAGMSPTTVTKALGELKGLGYVTWEQRHREGSRERDSNLYRLPLQAHLGRPISGGRTPEIGVPPTPVSAVGTPETGVQVPQTLGVGTPKTGKELDPRTRSRQARARASVADMLEATGLPPKDQPAFLQSLRDHNVKRPPGAVMKAYHDGTLGDRIQEWRDEVERDTKAPRVIEAKTTAAPRDTSGRAIYDPELCAHGGALGACPSCRAVALGGVSGEPPGAPHEPPAPPGADLPEGPLPGTRGRA